MITGFYGLEVAAASGVYAAKTTVQNNVGSRSGVFCSGSSHLQLHTVSAVECDRPFTCEFGATITGFKVTATSATLRTTYPAFYAFYDAQINLIGTSDDHNFVTNYETAFHARDSALITCNKPTYVTLSGVTTVANPPVGVRGNNNSLIDMDNLLNQSPGAEGDYTPTIVASENADNPSFASKTYYAQIGEKSWRVWGQINTGASRIADSNTETETEIEFTLPVSPAFTAQYQLAGTACTTSAGTQQRAVIIAESSSANAKFRQDGNTVLTGAAVWIFELVFTVP